MNHEDGNGENVVDSIATVDGEQEDVQAMNGFISSTMEGDDSNHHYHNNNNNNINHRHSPSQNGMTHDDEGEIALDENEVSQREMRENHNHHSSSSTMALRPLFFGNLLLDYSTDEITNLFEHPERIAALSNHINTNEAAQPIYIDRIDIKRGYCFVFLKDATSLQEKQRIESFCMTINGMNVPRVSRAIRAEFARGDGRVKRIEDERRKNIAPSATLFVVNFHESTTKREDLELLFEPFGKLLRIDMKRNYAFIQYASIAEATAAKEATNGGKLDQSVLTVEYVARQRDNENNNNNNNNSRNNNNNRGGRNRFNNQSNNDYSDRNQNDRGMGRMNDRGPASFGGGGGMSGGGRYDAPPSYDDRGRGSSSDRDRGRSEYRSGDPYYNRPTIYDNDRYSDRRASRDSPPPPLPPPPVASSASYPYHRAVGRSRSRSPPSTYRRRYPDEVEDRAVRDDYRGAVGTIGGGGGVGSSSAPYERRGSAGGSVSDHYPPRRGTSPVDRYRVSGSGSSYNDRDNRGYRG